MEEFAKEYSQGRDTYKPWEAAAPSAEKRAARTDKAEAADVQRGFPVDLEEAADAYYLLADVPGLEKSALSVMLSTTLQAACPSLVRSGTGACDAPARTALACLRKFTEIPF